jgi:hypothetical protein
MISRRVRDHVVHHNWFAVSVDLAIVVIGVFLGTQANDWNEARIEARQAREYRSMLIDDLEANRQNLDLHRRYYEWVRGEGLKTLAALDKPSSALGEQFLIDSYQSSQLLPWEMKRNTYEQIIASGDIGIIGDTAIRDHITNYYATSDVTGVNLTTVMPYRDILRRAMPYAVQNEIRTDCAEKILDDARGESEMVLPRNCVIKLDPATVRQAVNQVRGTPSLALDINRLLVDLDQKLISVDLISRRATTLEQALKRA